MQEKLDVHRDRLSVYAPKIGQASIPVDMIGEFIGPGGKNIKGLSEKYESEISIDDDGSCTILSQDQDSIDQVIAHIGKMTYKPKIGDVLNGEVVRILDFGAFVKITPNKDGLVHISEVKKERINKVEDHLNIGDMVDVKVIKVDDSSGKISLSIKALL